MSDLVAEWVEKAEGDCRTAIREAREAIRAMTTARAYVRARLGLKPTEIKKHPVSKRR